MGSMARRTPPPDGWVLLDEYHSPMDTDVYVRMLPGNKRQVVQADGRFGRVMAYVESGVRAPHQEGVTMLRDETLHEPQFERMGQRNIKEHKDEAYDVAFAYMQKRTGEGSTTDPEFDIGGGL